MITTLHILMLVGALQTPDGEGPVVQPAPPVAPAETRPEPIPDAMQTPPPAVAAAPEPEPAAPISDVAPPKKTGMPDFSGLVVSGVGGGLMVVGVVFGGVAAGVGLVQDFPGGKVEQQGAVNAAIVASVFFGLAGAVLIAVGLVLVGSSLL